MQHIESTENVTPGMVIVTGTNYYLVTEVFPRKFRGMMWVEMSKAWGREVDVTLPSPCHSAYEVEDPEDLFPMSQES